MVIQVITTVIGLAGMFSAITGVIALRKAKRFSAEAKKKIIAYMDEREKRLSIAYLINKYKSVSDPDKMMDLILEFGTRKDFTEAEYRKLLKAVLLIECRMCKAGFIKTIVSHE